MISWTEGTRPAGHWAERKAKQCLLFLPFLIIVFISSFHVDKRKKHQGYTMISLGLN